MTSCVLVGLCGEARRFGSTLKYSGFPLTELKIRPVWVDVKILEPRRAGDEWDPAAPSCTLRLESWCVRVDTRTLTKINPRMSHLSLLNAAAAGCFAARAVEPSATPRCVDCVALD